MNIYAIFGLFTLLLVYLTHVDCQSFVNITHKVFKPEFEGYLAAYVDFDSDKRTDILIISENGGSVFLYLAKQESQFENHTLLDNKKLSDSQITSVMPADFDGDSQTDILITWQLTNGSLTVEVYWGDGKSSIDDSPTVLTDKLNDQPLVLDFNGDLIPDIFGEILDSERFFWYFSPDRKVIRVQLFNGSSSAPFAPLHIPQSCAFVDWDGNLTPDLIITSTIKVDNENSIQFEIWEPMDGSFIWNHTIPAPDVKAKRYGIVTVDDIDQSSTMDLLLPVCVDIMCKESLIYAYNHSMWVKLPIAFTIMTHDWGFVPPAAVGDWRLKLQIMLRGGDLNLDGYQDYLAVLQKCPGDNKPCDQKAFVLINRECTDEECESFSRTFSILDSAPIFDSSNQDLIPSFFDTSENGKLDIFLTTYSTKPELKAFHYSSDLGSYFLKIMVVSGKCGDPCVNGDRALGVNLPGPTTLYETVKANGDPQTGTATQLTQSAYLSLQLPYVIYGLGQAPNSIDKLTVGITHGNNSDVNLNRTWTYVVPNTQMIIIPKPQNEPEYWKTRLFMAPSQLVILTAAALSGTFAFIILIVAVLHWREYIEDKKEKLQEAQKFHFDAM